MLSESRRKLVISLAALPAAIVLGCGGGAGAHNTSDQVWETRVDRAIGSEPCEAQPHRLDPTLYTGPLIDTHLHIPHPPDSRPLAAELDNPYLEVANLEIYNPQFPSLGVNVSIAEIACTLQNEGTSGAIAFFPVFQPTLGPSLEVVRRTMEQYPDLLFPFISPLGRQGGVPTVRNDDLVRTLAVHPGLFDGYGEIALYDDASSVSATDADNPPDSELFEGIFATATRERLAVYMHPGHEQFDSFDRVLAAFPDVNFIVHGEQIENEITDLMARHRNVYFTVNDLYGDQYLLHPGENPKSFLNAISDTEKLLARDLARWKEPIETYPDQFFWGTDRGGVAVWTFDLEVGRALSDYGRAFISRLDPEVQEKFAYRNALEALDRGFISSGMSEELE